MSWVTVSGHLQPEDRVEVAETNGYAGPLAHVQIGHDVMLTGKPEVLVEKFSAALTDCQEVMERTAGEAGDAD
jgi:hypothetical protein